MAIVEELSLVWGICWAKYWNTEHCSFQVSLVEPCDFSSFLKQSQICLYTDCVLSLTITLSLLTECHLWNMLPSAFCQRKQPLQIRQKTSQTQNLLYYKKWRRGAVVHYLIQGLWQVQPISSISVHFSGFSVAFFIKEHFETKM